MKRIFYCLLVLPVFLNAQKQTTLKAKELKVQNEVKKFVTLFEIKYQKDKQYFINKKSWEIYIMPFDSTFDFVMLVKNEDGSKDLQINTPQCGQLLDVDANGWGKAYRKNSGFRYDGIPNDGEGWEYKQLNKQEKERQLDYYLLGIIYLKRVLELK